GGSIGLWAVGMGHQAKRLGGRVITFEPVAHHRERLHENLRLNVLDETVEVFSIALGAREGTVRMTTNPVGSADNAWISSNGSLEVPLVTLDYVVREQGWSDIT